MKYIKLFESFNYLDVEDIFLLLIDDGHCKYNNNPDFQRFDFYDMQITFDCCDKLDKIGAKYFAHDMTIFIPNQEIYDYINGYLDKSIISDEKRGGEIAYRYFLSKEKGEDGYHRIYFCQRTFDRTFIVKWRIWETLMIRFKMTDDDITALMLHIFKLENYRVENIEFED